VLRSYAAPPRILAGERLLVRFWAYGPSVTMFINGPPLLPRLEAGQVLILPLKEKRPADQWWQLMADSGEHLTIPALPETFGLASLPDTGRAFILREIANNLSRGGPRDVSAVAGYLASQYEDLTGELMPLVATAVGDDQRRWAQVAASLLARQGIPRPSVSDLMSGRIDPKAWPLRPSLLLAQAAFQKLKASPKTDTLLIQTWIADAPWHAWGSANSLLEYADHPATTKGLRRALQNDLPGSSYITWVLAHTGHLATLPEALARALRVVDRPKGDLTDLQGAAALLRDFGNDQQLKKLAALIRKYQTSDRTFYSALWQYATEAGNPREARVLAVVLRDRRIISGDTRVCDFAVGVLERASSQHFGSGGKTGVERDKAVSQAQVWLRSQGLPD
jgi:hypothetical protein